jgi:hypothetical protein
MAGLSPMAAFSELKIPRDVGWRLVDRHPQEVSLAIDRIAGRDDGHHIPRFDPMVVADFKARFTHPSRIAECHGLQVREVVSRLKRKCIRPVLAKFLASRGELFNEINDGMRQSGQEVLSVTVTFRHCQFVATGGIMRSIPPAEKVNRTQLPDFPLFRLFLVGTRARLCTERDGYIKQAKTTGPGAGRGVSATGRPGIPAGPWAPRSEHRRCAGLAELGWAVRIDMGPLSAAHGLGGLMPVWLRRRGMTGSADVIHRILRA